jgi:hypothetical protein
MQQIDGNNVHWGDSSEVPKTMADNVQVVSDWLKSKKDQYFCHRCIGENTGVKKPAPITQLAGPLGNAADFRYRKTICSRCHSDRACAAFVGLA